MDIQTVKVEANPQVVENTKLLCSALERDFQSLGYPSIIRKFTFQEGKKYLKVIDTTEIASGRSVHCFIDKVTGDVYKAAGWVKPAVGIRFNIIMELNEILAKCDCYGRYL